MWGVAGRWYEWVDLRFFRKPLLLGPAALTGSARIFDCGRGRYLPPPANASGSRYYALAERSTGRIGVFAGWSRFKAEWPDGTAPSSLPQGSFVGAHELEEAFAFLGRRRPEQNQAKLYY